MKRAVQILILAALIPLSGTAREETLEERKKRITRKYMRERTQISQSDLYVPSDVIEDEQVTDSEQFKEVDHELEAQDAITRPYRPPQQHAVPVQAVDNWLLTDPELDADPFANPYGSDVTESGTGTMDDYWDLYGGRPSQAADKSASRRREAYTPPTSRKAEVEQEQRLFGNRSSGERTEIFGQRESGLAYPGSFGNPKAKTYGSSPSTGLLDSPFQTRKAEEKTNLREKQQINPYTPVSPLNRNPQLNPGSVRQPENQYTKPDSFKQWKERNKSWDPTSDDAYLDELMQKNRR